MKKRVKRMAAILLAGALFAGVVMTTFAGCSYDSPSERSSVSGIK